MNPLDFSIINEVYNSEKIDFQDVKAKLTELCEHNQDFVKIEFNLFRYKDYVINIQPKWQIFMQAENLRRLKDLELTCMPKLVAFRFERERKGMDYDMLITELPGVGRSWPLPFVDSIINDQEVKGLIISDIPLYSRQRLYNEIVGIHYNEKYWDYGCVNLSTCHWGDLKQSMLYIPSTETLFISRWSEVIPFGDEASRKQYQNNLKSMLMLNV